MLLRYIFALVATLGVFFVLAVIGGLVGWQGGSGVVVAILFFASTWFLWKKIVGGGKSNQQE